MMLILQIALGVILGLLGLRAIDVVYEWWKDQELWQRLVFLAIVALITFSALSNL